MTLRLMVVALLVVGSGSVFADEFTIANTGFLADGTTLGTPGVSTDGNWSFISCPAGSVCAGASVGTPVAPYVTNDGGYPFTGGTYVWMANDATSQWISPRVTYRDYLAGDPGSPGGAYTYRVSFDLTGLLPGTAYLSFRVAADNALLDVLINGSSVNTSFDTPVSFDFWKNGEVTGGFIAGINTLDFVVDNWDAWYDHDQDSSTPDIRVYTPSGLRVEFLESTASEIPEPATMGLMGFGLLALGVAFRRRKRLA